MNHPKPNKEYQALQAVLKEAQNERGRSVRLQTELENRFLAAWKFTRDWMKLSSRLVARLRMINKELDHLSFYTGSDDARVIVTQPYGEFAEQLKADFTLDDGTVPEVIDATEWAFYCPGKARLVILIFPSDYAKSLEKCLQKRRKRDIKAQLQQALA